VSKQKVRNLHGEFRSILVCNSAVDVQILSVTLQEFFGIVNADVDLLLMPLLLHVV
jgi:hypothetical protein